MRTALVLGGAACVWTDRTAAQKLYDPFKFDEVVAVNEVAQACRDTTFFVSLHPDKFPGAFAPGEYFPELWAPGGSTGSSGLFAARCAIELLKADKVILCGVPMDSQPHFYGGEPWPAADGFWPAWEAALPHIRDKVRSMSGRTRQLLGAPTLAWLDR